MDFDKLKEVWQENESRTRIDSESELNAKIAAVISTQRKIRRYFQLEMIIALIIIISGGALVYFHSNLDAYFLKLFAIVILGAMPIAIRMFLSMKRISGIDYTSQLKNSIVAATDHLKTTIRVYYTLLAITIISLIVMSFRDNYFLALPVEWQVGVMGYFVIFLIVSVRLINKFYGGRLKELNELSEDL